MEQLKTKWEQQAPPVRYGIAAGVVLVSLFIVVKILPALVAAMGIGVFLALMLVPYWIPTIIAFKRAHPSRTGIAALNFFLGWTFLGWVAAVVWSLTNKHAGSPQSIVISTYAGGSQTFAPPANHQVGDVINRHPFTGTAWIPLPPAEVPAFPQQTEQPRFNEVERTANRGV